MKLLRIAAPVLSLVLLAASGPLVAQYGPGPRAWDAPPAGYRDIQQQGYRDGIEGARKDVENHRRPDVNNRDEYRKPNVPGPVRAQYRAAFRQGYNAGMRHLMRGGRR